MDFVTVDAPCGAVRGRSKDGALLFAGIPYAEAPAGALRFRPPQPRPAFDGVFDALKFSPAAPQLPGGGMTDGGSVRYDEDCLSLNISTPACDNADRAVLVWIHGGAYRTGQGAIPWYAGGKFASQGDIVVVSINYRLGALGFLDLSQFGEEFELSSVNGILDQIMALRWVANNIRAFGGDPDRVTIAGESAGGFSVSTLLACEAAQGLFHRAIPQSGAAQHTLPKSASETVTKVFMEKLGHSDALGLEAASVEDILQAQAATVAELESGIVNKLGVPVSAFYPAHGNALISEPPIDLIRKGVGKDVALLTGSNTQETTLWGYGDVSAEKVTRTADSLKAEGTLEAYRSEHQDDPEAQMIALTSDHMFRIPAIRMVEARLEHTDANWMYLFNWQSRAFGGKLKATHALEIPFAFDNLDKAGVAAFLGPGDSPQHVADAMHSAWTQFINTGNPGWSKYTTPERITMIFDDTSETTEDPLGTTRAAWEGLR